MSSSLSISEIVNIDKNKEKRNLEVDKYMKDETITRKIVFYTMIMFVAPV